MSSLHELVDPWWVECDEFPLKRGQLIRAFIPHVGLTPYVLEPEARKEATQHDRALFAVRPLRIKGQRPQLPVAALPQSPGEVWAAYRAKVRPCVVISIGGPEVPVQFRPRSSPRWQSESTILVAPYYGVGRTEKRAGWHEPFVKRIGSCEYPQFLLDALPFGDEPASVLRLDQVQPVGRHHDSFSSTKFMLSEDAMDVIDQWLQWLHTGVLTQDLELATIRDLLLQEAPA